MAESNVLPPSDDPQSIARSLLLALSDARPIRLESAVTTAITFRPPALVITGELASANACPDGSPPVILFDELETIARDADCPVPDVLRGGNDCVDSELFYASPDRLFRLRAQDENRVTVSVAAPATTSVVLECDSASTGGRPEATYQRQFLENAPGFIILCAPDGTIRDISRTLPQHTREMVIGQNIGSFLHHASDAEELRERIGRVFATGIVDHFRAEGDGPDRSTAWYLGILAPFRTNGVRTGVIVNATDITTIVAEEEQVDRQRSAIRHAEEQARVAHQGAAFVHDLRGSIDNLKLTAQSIAARLDKRGSEDLDAWFLEAFRQVVERVDDLQSRAEKSSAFHREAKLTLEEVAVAEVIERAVACRRDELRTRAINLSVSIDSDVPRPTWDGVLISTALDNLLENAIHAIPDDKQPREIRITAVWLADEECVRLEVVDSGAGLADGLDVASIFRLHNTTKHDGSGLGLSICEWLVTHHGGDIRAFEESPPHGLRFRIDLPLRPPPQISGAPSRTES